MAAKALTGRILLLEAEKQSPSLLPTSNGFDKFIEDYIYSHHGFIRPVESSLQKNISAFVSEWCRRIRSLYKEKRYDQHLDKLLKGNHPARFDREIRFVTRPPTPPPSPKPSGSFIILVRSRKRSFLKFLPNQKMSGVF